MKGHVNTVDFIQLLAENVICYTRMLLLTCKLQEAGDGKAVLYIYFRAKYLIFPALFQIKSVKWRMIKDTKGLTQFHRKHKTMPYIKPKRLKCYFLF